MNNTYNEADRSLTENESVTPAGYYPLPQPDEIPVREREDAMGAYLMMFAVLAVGLPLPVFNLIAAIVYYYMNKSKSRFVHFHAHQSLISQLPISILNVGLIWWTISIFIINNPLTDYYKGYVIMVILANIIYVIASLVGAARARKGRFIYFIFFGKFSYHAAYGIRNRNEEIKNLPPKM
jgi:uncharacterized membrane protein